MITFEQLRDHYAPAAIALTGIGGSIHIEAAIGDVVITNRVIYYDQRRETPDRPRHRGDALEAPAAVGHALNSNFTDYGEPAVLDDEETGDQFRVHTGPIGSGDAGDGADACEQDQRTVRMAVPSRLGRPSRPAREPVGGTSVTCPTLSENVTKCPRAEWTRAHFRNRPVW